MVHALNKGKAGEREACKWLHENLGLKECPSRILDQAREGGADIIIDDFIIEVKRRETLGLKDWWYQVVTARKRHPAKHLIPIVMFRQNRKPWEFLIPAEAIGVKTGFLRITAAVFESYALNLKKGL